MRTRFITSAAKAADFPATKLREVAFLGRSNVGKSSLLNALAGSKIARTSRTPGRTQLINFFDISEGRSTFGLVDLPGHGYARAPRAVRAQWSGLVEDYLAMREELALVLLLLDARRGAEEDDLALHAGLVETLGVRGTSVEVVATKCDKLAKAEVKPVLWAIEKALGLPKNAVIATSASKGIGLDSLRKRLRSAVEAKDA